MNNAMASDGDVSNDTFFSNPEIHIGTAVAATVILLFSGLLAGLIPAGVHADQGDRCYQGRVNWFRFNVYNL